MLLSPLYLFLMLGWSMVGLIGSSEIVSLTQKEMKMRTRGKDTVSKGFLPNLAIKLTAIR